MLLQTTPTSPFGRKVRMAISHYNLENRIAVEFLDISKADDRQKLRNPLGKVPVLVRSDSSYIIDSCEIMHFIAHLVEDRDFLPKAPTCWHVLTLQALADGIVDAALLLLYEERYRSKEQFSERWISHQKNKIESALSASTAHVFDWSTSQPSLGDFALASALGYLDFRFEGEWRKRHSELCVWLSEFERKVASFAITSPSVPISLCSPDSPMSSAEKTRGIRFS